MLENARNPHSLANFEKRKEERARLASGTFFANSVKFARLVGALLRVENLRYAAGCFGTPLPLRQPKPASSCSQPRDLKRAITYRLIRFLSLFFLRKNKINFDKCY